MGAPTSFEILNGATVPADTYDPVTNPTGDKYYKLYKVSVTNGKGSIQTYIRPFAIEGGAGGNGGLPSNASKKKYMVLQLSADNNTSPPADDPTLNTWDYLRWH